MEEEKEIKQVKSYSLRPSQIRWLRQRAQEESTPEENVSASTILERIIDRAMKETTDHPSPSQAKKNALKRAVALAA